MCRSFHASQQPYYTSSQILQPFVWILFRLDQSNGTLTSIILIPLPFAHDISLLPLFTTGFCVIFVRQLKRQPEIKKQHALALMEHEKRTHAEEQSRLKDAFLSACSQYVDISPSVPCIQSLSVVSI